MTERPKNGPGNIESGWPAWPLYVFIVLALTICAFGAIR